MYATRTQLPPPKVCDNCESPNIQFCFNSVLYGTNKGDWPYCYYCFYCSSFVGCHPNTNLPLGVMATGATRRKRTKLHLLFDPVWKLGYMSRPDAYNWLASQLEIEKEMHISELSKDQLKAAILIMTAHNNNDYVLFKRRKEKNATRTYNRLKREDSRITIRKAKYQPK